ncbi:hypothetical protein AAHA92_12949 [Salvia divinorum]|uniref:Uncharacterized protein n=1 Tax=Salvia divinorum TaxID=28513 RepID=A0ABD1H9E8_SALDI
MYGDVETKEMEKALRGLGNRSFECPVLVGVMMVWLALQTSASHASLFSLEGKDDELRRCKLAAAVEALHERPFIEDRIKADVMWNMLMFPS